MKNPFSELAGMELQADEISRALYATDASIYRERPLGVVFPKSVEEVQRLVAFAERQQIPLIPRAAGTSLAGQCVGRGLVVDVSRYMNRLLELNVEERWVRVEPGMVRDELNLLLQAYGLWFGPNTSTSNRCTLGGMVGNNSSGSTSIAYGTTRDHLLEAEVVLSSGERAVFGAVHEEAFAKCLKKPGQEGEIYRKMHELLSSKEVQTEINNKYPKKSIHRRNTGYALDVLINSKPYNQDGPPLNLARLLCGSEGTLAFTTAVKLQLSPLPPPEALLFLPHFNSLQEALRAVSFMLPHKPYACELMDKALLDCTKNSRSQQANRFFIEGDPRAVLIVECRGKTKREAEMQKEHIRKALLQAGLGYAFPTVYGQDINKIWALRKAGLGVLANLPGRARAIACVEDTAVDVKDLPDYVADFSRIMEQFGQQAIYYAHAGAGELHIRPVLDLYDEKDFRALRQISEASARLVARYRGALSGEHGDGRLRAEFIPLVLGRKITSYLEKVKKIWDPQGIFNPGKIVHPPPMDSSLRVSPDSHQPSINALLDFSDRGGFFGAARRCTGSGDCRKSHQFYGNMCPSFQATREEKHSTRGRANALRELLQNNPKQAFKSKELKAVLDLCLSCKACASECPSEVDMAKLKAEFLYQYHRNFRRPLRDFLLAGMEHVLALSARMNGLPQRIFNTAFPGGLLRAAVGLSPGRRLPLPGRQHFFKGAGREGLKIPGWRGRLCLFIDPFTNYLEPRVAQAAVRLFHELGYELIVPRIAGAGRPLLSKGFLQRARKRAEKHLRFFREICRDGTPLIGVEPSELLSFRDEYPALVKKELREQARQLAQHCYLPEEFLARELRAGRLSPNELTLAPQHDKSKAPLLIHIHCHQKALSRIEDLRLVLETAAANSRHKRPVRILDAGCCGMAGAFGYEKEHHELSLQIGNLRLFPLLKNAPKNSTLIATGHSCRQQIDDVLTMKAFSVCEVIQGFGT